MTSIQIEGKMDRSCELQHYMMNNVYCISYCKSTVGIPRRDIRAMSAIEIKLKSVTRTCSYCSLNVDKCCLSIAFMYIVMIKSNVSLNDYTLCCKNYPYTGSVLLLTCISF